VLYIYVCVVSLINCEIVLLHKNYFSRCIKNLLSEILTSPLITVA
jgi:hypothetical protein